MTHIKEQLQAQLSMRGMSAYGLAKKAGLPISSVKNILQGKVANPRYDTLAAIADVLGVDPNSLMMHPKNQKHLLHSLAQTSDTFSVERFEEATTLFFKIYKDKNISMTKDRMLSLLDQVYEYMSFAEQKHSPRDISKSFVEWLLHQESFR